MNKDEVITKVWISNGQARLTVPAVIRRAKGWTNGTKISWSIAETGIIMLKRTE